jgi:hypothetical protein
VPNSTNIQIRIAKLVTSIPKSYDKRDFLINISSQLVSIIQKAYLSEEKVIIRLFISLIFSLSYFIKRYF